MSVVGLQEASTKQTNVGETEATGLYVVEFDDGSSIEVPERFLEAIDAQ